MVIFSKRATQYTFRAAWRVLAPSLALAVLAALSSGAADQKTELTLPAFRALVREQSPAEKQQSNLERAGEVFWRLLRAQNREAAARQSLDRLSGWYQAAQARLQAQNTPASDVELLRFGQAKAAARVAQFEAQRRSAAEEANLLLKRPASSPLVALMEAPAEAIPPRTDPKSENAAAAAPAIGPDIASRRAAFEKELLPLGNELLRKMYQSYLFGGIPLTSLLWQEQEVYRTDLEYRRLLEEAARAATGAKEPK